MEYIKIIFIIGLALVMVWTIEKSEENE